MIRVPEWQPGQTAICDRCCDETEGTQLDREDWSPISETHWLCAKCSEVER